MDKHEIRRTYWPLTAEERLRWQRGFEEEEQAIPENIARLQRRRAATAEQTTNLRCLNRPPESDRVSALRFASNSQRVQPGTNRGHR